ncbi:hypothetical protein [Agromyces sp. H66]|uniref:hypothetical protein n=1 Tax=Agromyces sp. H66 TaxID=2529859 RepID=UPI00145B6B8C|nr:hypothetical protein [Agromyces sp. H66]
MMVLEQVPGDHRELVLAVAIAGGGAVAGMAAPRFIAYAGHTGAEYVYMGALLAGPVVFVIAGVIAFLVYRFGRSVLHHALLAAITALIVGGLSLVPATRSLGLVNLMITTDGAYVAAAAVFLGLLVGVGMHRHLRAARVTMERAAASTGSTVPAPRMPLAVIVLLAGVAAGALQVVASVARSFEFFTDPRNGGFLAGQVLWALFAAIAVGLVAAWAVLVVLLVDQWVAPRLVRALGAGVFAALALAVPPFVIGGGPEYGGEQAVWGVLSAAAAAMVVAVAERRVAPRVVPAAAVADPDVAAEGHPSTRP